MPYKSTWDCFVKMWHYEGNMKFHSNFGGAFYAGGQAYFVRLFAICYLSQFILDIYHGQKNVSEFWSPMHFMSHGGINYDIHDPFTKGFNMFMNTKWSSTGEEPEYHPDYDKEIRNV